MNVRHILAVALTSSLLLAACSELPSTEEATGSYAPWP